ncbi:MAG: uroporphyrinogen decarboxylase family protein [Kiritimatiellae bacterium]|nr:uroporphyrinogen decarboxylase family protein [Kiritimatiellia bacterium]
MRSKMSSKERILAAVKHQEIDYVPVAPRIWAWFLEYYGKCGWQTYLRAAEEFDFDPVFDIGPGLPSYIGWPEINDGCAKLKNVKFEKSVRRDKEFKIVRRRFITPAGELTDEMRVPPAGGDFGIAPNPENTEWLLKTEEDLEKIKCLLPDPALGDYRAMFRTIDEIKGRALAAARPTVGSDGMLLLAMGVENAMINYMANRKFITSAFDIFHEYNHAVAKKCLEAGANVIFDSGYNMSLSTGWSPEAWRELFYPKVKAMCDLAHSFNALYFYYDDGKMMKILPYLAEIGADIVETCTPPPVGDFVLKEAKEKWGKRLCFKGYIETVHVMRLGTPAKIREAVAETIRLGAPGGGFILGTSDSIRDGTPLENIKAYFSAAREFGKITQS